MGPLLAIIITFLIMVTPGSAAVPDMTTILRQMKQVLEPTNSSTRRVVISSSFQNQTDQFVAAQARKMFPDGKRILWVMLEPESVRGTTYLFWERQKLPNVTLAYFPFIRRVREFLPVESYGRFFGTDFTFADLGFVRVHNNYKFWGKEEFGGIPAYKVEERFPEERLFYSRILIWLAADSFLPLQREYYDLKGRLWKTEFFKEVVKINTIATPLLIQMKDRDGYSTDLKVTEVQYDVKIPDDLFNPDQLPQAINYPVWQTYGPGTGQSK